MSVTKNIQISRIDRVTFSKKKIFDDESGFLACARSHRRCKYFKSISKSMNVELIPLIYFAQNKKSTGPLTDQEESLVDFMLEALLFNTPGERYKAAHTGEQSKTSSTDTRLIQCHPYE